MAIFDFLKGKPQLQIVPERKVATLVMRESDFRWDMLLKWTKHNAPDFYRNVWNIYKCIKLIAENLADLPVQLFQRGTERGKDIEIFDHPVLSLLDGKANELQTGTDFLVFYAASMLVSGNAYGRIAGTRERPVAVWPLFPQCVQAIPGKAEGEPAITTYRYVTSKTEDIPGEDIMHGMYYNPGSMIEGLSPIEVAKESAETQQLLEQWNKNLIKKGAKADIIMAFKSWFTDEQWKEAQRRAKSGWEGVDNAGGVKFVDGEVDIHNIGFSPKDMDWLNAQKISARQIGLIYGVDPSLLGDPEHKTYENYQDAWKALLTKTVIPLARKIYKTMAFYFFYDQAKNRTTHYFRIKVEDIPELQNDTADRHNAITQAWDMTIDEKRLARGLEELGGEIGKMILAPNTLVPIDMMTGDTEKL